MRRYCNSTSSVISLVKTTTYIAYLNFYSPLVITRYRGAALPILSEHMWCLRVKPLGIQECEP